MIELRDYKIAAPLCLAAALCFGGPAASQTARPYPQRPVTIVAPGGSGNAYDLVARVLAQHFGEKLGKAFVVANMSGAGTLVATRFAATSAPDGHTLVVGGLSNMVWNSALYKQPGYDPKKDFVPIGMAYSTPYVATVSSVLPVSSLAEFISFAKANPGKITMAHPGLGSGPHLMSLNLIHLAGIDLTLVPYRGGNNVYPDLITGRVDAYVDVVTQARTHIIAKAIKPLVLLSETRSPIFPDVPTSAEAGLRAWKLQSWLGLFAPAKTPPEVVALLRKTLAETVQLPDVKKRFEGTSGEVFYRDAQKTQEFVDAEFEKWTQLIKSAGIELNP